MSAAASPDGDEFKPMDLQPGQLIQAPFLPAPAEVKKFEPRAGYYLLEVVLDDGHHTFKPVRITAEQLAEIQVLERNPVALTANVGDFFYVVEAQQMWPAVIGAGQMNLRPQLQSPPSGTNRSNAGRTWRLLELFLTDYYQLIRKEP